MATQIKDTCAFSIVMVLIITCCGCSRTTTSTDLKGGNLADQSFIHGYDMARIRAIKDTPAAIISLNEQLFFFRYGKLASNISVSSNLYTALKDVSHVVLGVWLAVWNAQDKEARNQSKAYGNRISKIESGLTTSGIPDDLRGLQLNLLMRSRKLVQMAQDSDGVSKSQLEQWATSVTPDLLANVQHATRAKLETINKSMKHLAKKMTDQEKSKLIVVVCGVHQARRGNLQMQYFSALLGPGAADHDRRLLFAESITHLDDAVDLLGAHQLDRAISESFFGTPYRMQRDLLDDAATDIIPTLNMPQGM